MTTKSVLKKLTPGSKQAIRKGCICPVVDNAYGEGSGYVAIDKVTGKKDPLFWFDHNCPIHGKAESIPGDTLVYECDKSDKHI